MIRVSPLLAMIGLSMLGNSSLVVQPMIVGGLVESLGFSEQQAGFVASVELSGIALGLLFLIGFVQRIPSRFLAGAAVLVVILANLVSCNVHQFSMMLPVRFVAGLGAAMALAVFLTMAASGGIPEKTFAVVNAISIAYSGVLTPFAPAMLATWKLPGLFLTLAAVAMLLSPVLAGVGRSGARRENSSRGETGGRGFVKVLPSRVAMLLIMMLLVYSGHGAIWAYQQRIGVGLGLSAAEVGKWIGLSMLIGGVGGSLLARMLGLIMGRVWPQILSLGMSAVAVLFLVLGTTPFSFAMGGGLVALSWFYGLPYQMGLLAAFDPRGRANMAGVVMTTGGAAAGPAVAAILIGHAGHWAIGLFAAACYGLSLILVLPAAIELTRRPPVEVTSSV
jgi:predicted MFS family arabinose efflux permease